MVTHGRGEEQLETCWRVGFQGRKVRSSHHVACNCHCQKRDPSAEYSVVMRRWRLSPVDKNLWRRCMMISLEYHRRYDRHIDFGADVASLQDTFL